MGSFTDSLKANVQRVLQEVNYKISYAAYMLFTYTINRSPGGVSCTIGPGLFVDGNFINNWFPAINAYDPTTTTTGDISGRGSIMRLQLIKDGNAFLGKDSFVSLSNNLNYAHRVEYAGWPQGKDPSSGWYWTGRAMIYAPVQYAFQDIKANI